MTEYWQSQARKFCDFCKCWIADQKCSIEFHESGKRHQQAVKDRLRDIGQKGARDQKKSAKEEQWMKQIEQQAMKDYRAKDLQENSDLTAKIFNEKRSERDNERLTESSIEESKRKYDASRELNINNKGDNVPSETKGITGALTGPGPPEWGTPSKSSATDAGPSSKKSPFEQRVSAKTHGTKYHNPPPETNWREAITEDGNVYYWHTISHVSIWEPPADGFISIKDQEKATERFHKMDDVQARKLDNKKREKQLESTKKCSTSSLQGPVTKPDPYGSWQTVPDEGLNYRATAKSSTIDYQTPQVKQAPASNLVLHNDRTKRFEIGSKKTPSLGLDEEDEFQVDYSAGIKSTATLKSCNSAEKALSSNNTDAAAKPAIVFRKRKVNPDHRKVARRREDED